MKRFPDAPSLKRKTETIRPRVEIVIVCEGKNTEPRYFSDCADYYGAGLVRLKIVAGAGVPLSVVKEAIAERDRLLQARRSGKGNDSFTSCFRVWAVFDRDEHPSVKEAIKIASDNKLDIAYSDPCFELWPILHLLDYGAQDDRHKLQTALREEMPKYDHETGAFIDFDLIKEKVDLAIGRARTLLKMREAEGRPNGCPSTTVGILVGKIRDNGKISISRSSS